jgi:Na+/proline symporter
MSTVSTSHNSLASSTLMDLYERLGRGASLEPKAALRVSRGLTLFWGIVFIGFASLFQDTQNPVVELGLAIASFTYGGLLGVFMLGLVNRQAREWDAILAFAVTILFMIAVIFGVWHSPQEGWLLVFNPDDETIAALGLRSIGWPWYTVIGSLVMLGVGSLLGLRHRRRDL